MEWFPPLPPLGSCPPVNMGDGVHVTVQLGPGCQLGSGALGQWTWWDTMWWEIHYNLAVQFFLGLIFMFVVGWVIKKVNGDST